MSDQSSIIKVTGKGIVRRPAEVAEFRIEIEESGDDPGELMRIVVERNNRIVEMLRQELSDDEITARGTWIRRHEKQWWIDEEKEAPYEPAFDGTAEIWVTTEKLEVVGLLMSRAMATGASSVSRPTFTVKDPGAMTIEAVARATEAARVRAETVSQVLGLKLGPVTKVEAHTDAGEPGGSGGNLFVGAARALSLGGPSDDWDIDGPTIIPADQILTQFVSATFEVLGPEA